MAPEPVTAIVSARIATFFVPLMLKRLYAMLGDVSLTAMVTTLAPVPPGPVAVTVYGAEADTTDGVPERMPLDVFKDNPVGRDGLTE